MKSLAFNLFLILGLITISNFSCQKDYSFDDGSRNITRDSIPKDTIIRNAVFSFNGFPNACLNDTIKGVYGQDVPLSDSNYVVISLNVTSVGKYNVSTNSLNGFSFADSGIFKLTGIQTINIKGRGIPVKIGNTTFTINGKNSSCNFNIVVNPVFITSNPDHFPLTSNSYWTYDDNTMKPDTIKRVVTGNTISNGTSYQIIHETFRLAQPVDYYFRKSDTIYNEFAHAEKYTTSFQFVPDILDEILFLKENLKNNESWVSKEYIGPFSSGQKVYFQYYYTCQDANALVTINGITFANVYKILVEPKIHSEFSFAYNNTGEKLFFYYAKGVGLIYRRIEIPNNAPRELTIRNWKVF